MTRPSRPRRAVLAGSGYPNRMDRSGPRGDLDWVEDLLEGRRVGRVAADSSRPPAGRPACAKLGTDRLADVLHGRGHRLDRLEFQDIGQSFRERIRALERAATSQLGPHPIHRIGIFAGRVVDNRGDVPRRRPYRHGWASDGGCVSDLIIGGRATKAVNEGAARRPLHPRSWPRCTPVVDDVGGYPQVRRVAERDTERQFDRGRGLDPVQLNASSDAGSLASWDCAGRRDVPYCR